MGDARCARSTFSLRYYFYFGGLQVLKDEEEQTLTMGFTQTSLVGLTTVLCTLLIILPPSEQQYAWRPQGRFGKRAGGDQQNFIGSPEVLTESLRHLDSLDNSNRIKMLDTSVFETDGVLCIAAGAKGLYRCFSFDEETAAANDI